MSQRPRQWTPRSETPQTGACLGLLHAAVLTPRCSTAQLLQTQLGDVLEIVRKHFSPQVVAPLGLVWDSFDITLGCHYHITRGRRPNRTMHPAAGSHNRFARPLPAASTEGYVWRGGCNSISVVNAIALYRCSSTARVGWGKSTWPKPSHTAWRTCQCSRCRCMMRWATSL